jgi:predicted RNase H-like HicB family nuclease
LSNWKSEAEIETQEIANNQKFLRNLEKSREDFRNGRTFTLEEAIEKYIKTIEHRGFTGTVEYSKESKCFYGKVLEIDDLVMYEGQTIEELEHDFKETINEYIEDLKAVSM